MGLFFAVMSLCRISDGNGWGLQHWVLPAKRQVKVLRAAAFILDASRVKKVRLFRSLNKISFAGRLLLQLLPLVTPAKTILPNRLYDNRPLLPKVKAGRLVMPQGRHVGSVDR
jgi:hypothetical protein